MAHICINAGHTVSGKGSGAIGLLNEGKETRRVASFLADILRDKGHKVTEATIDKSNDYTKEVASLANKSNADLFLSIHFNAGGGKGVECYTWRGSKTKIAVNVCDNLSKLNFVNRGVKDGSSFYVIKRTVMPAVLIEVCFVDTLSDVLLYKKNGAKKIAKAIADGIKI